MILVKHAERPYYILKLFEILKFLNLMDLESMRTYEVPNFGGCTIFYTIKSIRENSDNPQVTGFKEI